MQASTKRLQLKPETFGRIGGGKRRRGEAAGASIEQRRERLPPNVWKFCFKIAYDEIPKKESPGNVDQLLDDFCAEVKYLRQIGTTDAKREEQRCIGAIGLQQTKVIALEERLAHQSAVDISSSDNDDDEAEYGSESGDLADLVVSDEDEEPQKGLKRLCAPRETHRKTISIDDEEEVD